MGEVNARDRVRGYLDGESSERYRERFNYNPELFLSFINNPKNVDEMVRLGILVKREEPKPEPIVADKSPEVPPASGS